MDRMGSGEHLGQCPTCGGLRWWDQRGRKRSGEVAPDAADYRCTDCRHERWEDGRHAAGRASARRRGEVTTTTVEAVVPTADGRCAATTKAGKPCGGMAMAGSPYCGPHAGGHTAAPPAARGGARCEGQTKAGNPCGAGAVRGERWCPAHRPS
jgi:hypothetical protein